MALHLRGDLVMDMGGELAHEVIVGLGGGGWGMDEDPFNLFQSEGGLLQNSEVVTG